MGTINNGNTNNNRTMTRPDDRSLFENSFQSTGCMPIALLNSSSTNWKIKAKIEVKTAVRTWNKGDKQFTKFSIIICDSKGGKVEGVFWGDAVARFYDTLVEGSV